MKSFPALKLLPQLFSCVSKCSLRTFHKLPRRHVKNIYFQPRKRFSVLADTSVVDPSLIKLLDQIEVKYGYLSQENEDLDLNLGEEFKKGINIQEVKRLFKEIANVRQNIIVLEELSSENPKDMEVAVKEEMKEYEAQIIQLKSQLLEALIPEDDEDRLGDVILEVNAGVGGQEAMLFSAEIFQMYCNYATHKGWAYNVMELAQSELGGLRKGCIQVSGTGSCRLLRFEGGVHRVQRVPKTEKGGRIHTSTASVAVLPQPHETDIILLEKDLKVETKRASGAGGQHVQTTDSAVRVVHLPSGLAADCQVERFQHRNKEIAIQKLRAMLYQKQRDEQQSKISSSRKIQVGSKGRSEKIRTYNFNQDRITDHRIGKSMHNLSSFLGGGDLLDEMINVVYRRYKMELLEAVLKSISAQ